MSSEIRAPLFLFSQLSLPFPQAVRRLSFRLSFSGGFVCLLNKLAIHCKLPLSLCICVPLSLPQMGTWSFRLQRERRRSGNSRLNWTCLEFLSVLKCHHLCVCLSSVVIAWIWFMCISAQGECVYVSNFVCVCFG